MFAELNIKRNYYVPKSPYQRHDVLVFPTICKCGKAKGKRKITGVKDDEKTVMTECIYCKEKTEVTFDACNDKKVKHEPKPTERSPQRIPGVRKVYYGGIWGNGR